MATVYIAYRMVRHTVRYPLKGADGKYLVRQNVLGQPFLDQSTGMPIPLMGEVVFSPVTCRKGEEHKAMYVVNEDTPKEIIEAIEKDWSDPISPVYTEAEVLEMENPAAAAERKKTQEQEANVQKLQTEIYELRNMKSLAEKQAEELRQLKARR